MIDVVCIRGLGDKQGQEIEDPLITTERGAVLRGTSFINENWYKRRSRTISVPYKTGIAVGIVAGVNVGKLGVSGNHYVNNVTISIDTNGIMCAIDIEQHIEGS